MVQTKRILFSVGLGVITLIILMVIINPLNLDLKLTNPFKLNFTFTGFFAGNRTLNETEPLLESLEETTSTTSVETTTSTTTPKILTTIVTTTSVKATTTTTLPSTTTTTITSTTTTVPQDANIVINEIMYNPPGSDVGNEWIEIYNKDDYDCNISCWKFFEGGTNHGLTFEDDTIIPAESYAIIADDIYNFLEKYPDYDGVLIDSTFSLLNDGEYIALKDCSLNVVDEVTYNKSWGGYDNNRTIEKYVDSWFESLVNGGTPGYDNSVFTSTTTTTTTSTTTTTTTLSTTTTTVPITTTTVPGTTTLPPTTTTTVVTTTTIKV